MARSFLSVGLLGVLLAACSESTGEPGPGEENPGVDGGDRLPGGVPASAPDDPSLVGDPVGTVEEQCGTPVATDLGAADSRFIARAAHALAEIQTGSWPQTAPSSGELFAYLGPRVGPEGGRFIGHLTETRLDAVYLAAPVTPAPVHIIVVVDLGPSIRTEVPLIVGALDTLASRIATSPVEDRLSVVEWTDEAAIGIRLATRDDVTASVADYTAALQARVQFGGSPSLSAVGAQVTELAAFDPNDSDHVILLTDGSMSAKDSTTLDAVSSWRADSIAISLVELQAVDPEVDAGPVAIHDALLSNRSISDAGYYLAATVIGDPSRPPARSVAPDQLWQIEHLFGDRFDDLFRPTDLFAHVEVTAPPELRLEPLSGIENEASDLPGGVRFGTNGSIFAQANVTNPVCADFAGKVRVIGARASNPEQEIEIASSDVTFDYLGGHQAYFALFGALDSIAGASSNKTCQDSFLQTRAKLAEAPIDGLGEKEKAAFESTRERTLLVIDALTALCQTP
ncbi:MAG: VWA domain-containing protein [Polyangiaceae bacterium]|nr:VWA domain-containing protein [Polyangiaceae bacterium]